MGGLPYESSRGSEDAEDFMKRMKAIDERVAKHLNAIHQRKVEEVNRGRREKPIYQVGGKGVVQEATHVGRRADKYMAGAMFGAEKGGTGILRYQHPRSGGTAGA